MEQEYFSPQSQIFLIFSSPNSLFYFLVLPGFRVGNVEREQPGGLEWISLSVVNRDH